jgi:hypothetical protein
LPELKDCHKATVDYIPTLRNRRNTSKSVAIEILPKVFHEKKMSQIEKVDLIREQVKKIEKE